MTKVFKFGGASVKDSASMLNAHSILSNFKEDKILLIVSAMGKTTNSLEVLHKNWFGNKPNNQQFNIIKDYHYKIILDLFPENHKVNNEVDKLFSNLELYISQPKTEILDFDSTYDNIVHYGELLSSCILYNFLELKKHKAVLLDARKVVIADDNWRDAKVFWEETQKQIQEQVQPLFQSYNIVVSQGFIASTLSQQKPITLGREGSDFSASIFAYCLNSESVTIWKDVPGLYNADPKEFNDVEFIPHISYKEAVELAYYGQSIIHPKTIKPLQIKSIPLYIKSFVYPNLQGTIIDSNTKDDLNVSSFILKKSQLLISVYPKDFSFIDEQNLKEVFNILSKLRIKIHVMQNSALSFSFCTDMNELKLELLLKELSSDYNIKYNNNLELITIRNYTEELINKLTFEKKVILEQKSRTTAQLVVVPNL